MGGTMRIGRVKLTLYRREVIPGGRVEQTKLSEHGGRGWVAEFQKPQAVQADLPVHRGAPSRQFSVSADPTPQRAQL